VFYNSTDHHRKKHDTSSDPQYKHTKNYYSEAEYQNTDVRNSEAEGNILSRRRMWHHVPGMLEPLEAKESHLIFKMGHSTRTIRIFVYLKVHFMVLFVLCLYPISRICSIFERHACSSVGLIVLHF